MRARFFLAGYWEDGRFLGDAMDGDSSLGVLVREGVDAARGGLRRRVLGSGEVYLKASSWMRPVKVAGLRSCSSSIVVCGVAWVRMVVSL